MRRVVITGIGLVSPLGCDLDEAAGKLRAGGHGIVAIPEWEQIGHFAPRVAARAVVPQRVDRGDMTGRSHG